MSDTNTGPAVAQAGETSPAEATTPETETDPAQDDSETFPREVVEKLRRENAGYRDRANKAERALFAAKVAATGKVDPSAVAEIPFDADILDDHDAINAAIDAAICERPFIKARKLSGDAGQGPRGGVATAPTFASLLQQR